MFDSLTNRLDVTLKKLRGQARLTPENMKETLREIRRALLEADVGLPVIKDFLSGIETQYEGQKVSQQLSPGQHLIKIIHKELILLLGEKESEINLAVQPPALILLAGLQGVGKTTTAAKLAKKLKDQKKKVLLTSCDVYRPAAIEQLRILAEKIDVEFFTLNSQEPIEIAKQAKQYATQYLFDVLVVDTAGRLNVDEKMMKEIADLQMTLSPIETLFVADSQQGQDAVNVSRTFAERIDITGVVLTKVDGDARGGAILSVRHVLGRPIKLISVGEKIEDVQSFHPNRIASRILGMGDMLGLIEQIEGKIDKEKSQKIINNIKVGQFNFNDMLSQLKEIGKVGGIQSMLEKLPGMGRLGGKFSLTQSFDNKLVQRQIAIILSMTPQERADPSILKGARRRRIASGSGQTVQQVNQLLKQQREMKNMMKQFKNKNFNRQISGLISKNSLSNNF